MRTGLSAVILMMLAPVFLSAAEPGAALDAAIVNSFHDNNIPGENTLTVMDRHGDFLLIKREYNGWQSAAYLYDSRNDRIREITAEGPHVISLRFVDIDYLDRVLIELVDSSNMGNGFLYLLDLDLAVLLKTYFYDAHYENWGYAEFHFMKLFSEREYTGEEISDVFRDNYRLTIDYHFNGMPVLIIYGIRDFISELDGKREVILSEHIETFYAYSKKDNAFQRILPGDIR